MTNRFFVEPDSSEFTPLSPQHYRESAIMWQLRALQAQSEAVESMAAEHGINLEDISPQTFYQRANDLVASATVICQQAANQPATRTLAQIKTLRANADALRADVSLFVKVADHRSAFRLSSLLPSLAEQFHTGVKMLPGRDGENKAEAEPAEDRDCLVVDPQKLQVASARRCHAAGCEQHNTFSMQINALCDVVMENCLAAAAAGAVKHS